MAVVAIPTSETGAIGIGQSVAKATAPAILMVDPASLVTFSRPTPPTPVLVCRYNPKTLTISGGTEWEDSESTDQRGPPNRQFKHSKARTLKMDLLIDLFFLPYGDVDWELRALQDWCTPRQHMLNPLISTVSPPYLRLQWGAARYFKCVLEEYEIKHTLFSKTGSPMRAEVSVTLKEVADRLPGTNPTSGGVGGEREHEVRAGDTLHSIANEHYGRASLWRGLAAFNQIEDPIRIAPGTLVALPPVSDLEELS